MWAKWIKIWRAAKDRGPEGMVPNWKTLYSTYLYFWKVLVVDVVVLLLWPWPLMHNVVSSSAMVQPRTSQYLRKCREIEALGLSACSVYAN